jgi:hypothetical protein
MAAVRPLCSRSECESSAALRSLASSVKQDLQLRAVNLLKTGFSGVAGFREVQNLRLS